ncbi:hypothetical protein SAMN02910358_01780 [Lachnospiraceae bacterium XBB1006]|nr:hypothetical protein SAMN02910358_01780 [Lachnospiraceae bacterium XBB1006]
MQRKMQELAAGVFVQDVPHVKLTPERLNIEALEAETIQGSFFIESMNQISMQGIVLSDHPRMQIHKAEFSGTSAEISYEFHTEGLVEGDIQKGNFVLICNKNEYTLSFVVSIHKPQVTVDGEVVKSAMDVAVLARRDYEKAYELFSSDLFFTIMEKESKECQFDMPPVK